ncbi:MAG: hypothetical protein AB7U18_08960 [Dehalococcoidia bacterium]
MDVTSLGVSVVAVGAASSLIVQVIKAIAVRVPWMATLGGGTTALLAYLVSVGLMYALTLAGYGPVELEGVVGAITTLAAGLGSGLAAQGIYTGTKAVARAGEAA